MGVRETINRNKPLGIAIVALMIAVSGGVLYSFNRNGDPAPLTKGYFSDDDGKTYFVDSSNKICPFDHDGKQAVQAFVFQYGGGKPFVAYLSRFNDSGRRRMEELRAMPKSPDTTNAMRDVATKSLEYKRPGDPKWAPVNSPAAGVALNPTPPAGETGDLTQVDP